jgi:hypothetical protein
MHVLGACGVLNQESKGGQSTDKLNVWKSSVSVKKDVNLIKKCNGSVKNK